MAIVRSPALRQALAAVLLVVLTLSGAGRSRPLADEVSGIRIAGITVEICHAGGKPGPGEPANHDCCDACALCAPVALPGAAPFAAPTRIEHVAEHRGAVTWAPAIASVPTPRLSQGPPAA